MHPGQEETSTIKVVYQRKVSLSLPEQMPSKGIYFGLQPDQLLKSVGDEVEKKVRALKLLGPNTGTGSTALRVQGLPKGSNLVPFWVYDGFLVRDDNILPKKELHRRVWVVIVQVERRLGGLRRSPEGYVGAEID